MRKNILKDVLVQTLDPILISFGFKRKGYRWYRVVNRKVVHMIRRQPMNSIWSVEFDLCAIHTSMGVSVDKADMSAEPGMNIFFGMLSEIANQKANYSTSDYALQGEKALFTTAYQIGNDLIHYGVPYLDSITTAADFITRPDSHSNFWGFGYGPIAKMNVQLYKGMYEEVEETLLERIPNDEQIIKNAKRFLSNSYENYVENAKKELKFKLAPGEYKKMERQWRKNWDYTVEQLPLLEERTADAKKILSAIQAKKKWEIQAYLDKQEAYTKASVKEYLKIDMDAMK